MKSVFSGDMCVGKNTAQPASVRAKRVRRRRLHPFEHVLARAREPVDFVDGLRAHPLGELKIEHTLIPVQNTANLRGKMSNIVRFFMFLLFFGD